MVLRGLGESLKAQVFKYTHHVVNSEVVHMLERKVSCTSKRRWLGEENSVFPQLSCLLRILALLSQKYPQASIFFQHFACDICKDLIKNHLLSTSFLRAHVFHPHFPTKDEVL